MEFLVPFASGQPLPIYLGHVQKSHQNSGSDHAIEAHPPPFLHICIKRGRAFMAWLQLSSGLFDTPPHGYP